MDKTSFIPKKTFTKPFYKEKGFGIFLWLSIALLIASGWAFGGVYYYKQLSVGRVDGLSESLKQAKASFEPSLISQLSSVANKIELSKGLIRGHKTLIPIFDFLEQSTLKSVRFSSFEYSSSEDGEEISMKGSATSYASLALQIEEFQNSIGVKNVSVSGLSLGKGGAINFNIKVVFESDFVKYKIR